MPFRWITNHIWFDVPLHITSWTRSKQHRFIQAPHQRWLCLNLKVCKYFLSFRFRSLINDLYELARVYVMYRWWKECLLFFPSPPFLWRGVLRSRRAGVQIDSIERSLIVPLRHARKLKLMMDWGREWETLGEEQTGRGQGVRWREKKHWKQRVKTKSGGDRWENAQKGNYRSWSADGDLLFVSENKRGLGSHSLSDDPSLAGSRGKEDRRRAEGGDREGMDDSSINAK